MFLDGYPSPNLHNGKSVVMGYYAGPKMVVGCRGSLQVGLQNDPEADWQWFSLDSEDGVVPLGRWIRVAIEADVGGTANAWIDGQPISLRANRPAGTTLRPSFGAFYLGADPVDGQAFPGSIQEAWVWSGPSRLAP